MAAFRPQPLRETPLYLFATTDPRIPARAPELPRHFRESKSRPSPRDVLPPCFIAIFAAATFRLPPAALITTASRDFRGADFRPAARPTPTLPRCSRGRLFGPSAFARSVLQGRGGTFKKIAHGSWLQVVFAKIAAGLMRELGGPGIFAKIAGRAKSGGGLAGNDFRKNRGLKRIGGQ